MKILEKTNYVLMLHQSSRNFWFNTTFFLFNSIVGLLIALVLVSSGEWWGFLLLLITTCVFCLALQNLWKSDVVKDCSFNKALGRVTIKFHGLQTKIKDLPLQEIRAVEVRKTTGIAYGVVIENYQLYLVTRYAEAIPVSQNYHINFLEAIAHQVREFLNISSY